MQAGAGPSLLSLKRQLPSASEHDGDPRSSLCILPPGPPVLVVVLCPTGGGLVTYSVDPSTGFLKAIVSLYVPRKCILVSANTESLCNHLFLPFSPSIPLCAPAALFVKNLYEYLYNGSPGPRALFLVSLVYQSRLCSPSPSIAFSTLGLSPAARHGQASLRNWSRWPLGRKCFGTVATDHQQ